MKKKRISIFAAALIFLLTSSVFPAYASSSYRDLEDRLDDILEIDSEYYMYKDLGRLSQLTLQTAMQEDSIIRNQIKQLEDKWNKKWDNKVSIYPSDDSGIKKEDVSIIGAGLSYKNKHDVEFHIQKSKWNITVNDRLYQDISSYALSLKNVTNPLKVPVSITMPIPENIEADRLILFQYNSNNTYKAIEPVVLSGKKARFTVREMGTYVFAEKKYESEQNNGNNNNNNNSGSGSQQGNGSSPTTSPSTHGVDRYKIGEATGWYYFKPYWKFLKRDGYYAASEWIQSGDHWYFFNTDETMYTGWHYDNSYNGWFYFLPDGAMATGWNNISERWYYFNPVSNGYRGVMMTNCVIDGYQIGPDGIRR